MSQFVLGFAFDRLHTMRTLMNLRTNRTLQAYVELSKLRIVTMVLVTTTIGYLLGGKGAFSWFGLFFTLLGTGLAAAGSAALNNYLERDIDALMERTKGRVLPAGTMEPAHVLAFGLVLVIAGVSLLVWQVNLLTGFLVLVTAFLYVLVYTPLKRLSWINTPIGAIPGALPPLNGWAAASGEVELGAWVLFLILFAWQHPHFYAIAWMCKEDYAKAGFKMLPVIEPSGQRMFRQSILYAVLLLLISIVPTWIGMTGGIYLVGAVLIGAMFLVTAIEAAGSRSLQSSRRLLRASVIYLPVLLALILCDAAA